MNFWRLVSPDHFTAPAMISHHSHLLCLVAVLLAVLAASVLLPVTQRYHQGSASHRRLWLLVGGTGMGVGIWAMHFTAMLAFSLPVEIEYDLATTVISVLPAMLASMACIHLYRPEQRGARGRHHLAALILAMGVGSMHYIGMEALIVDADMYYVPNLFIASLLAAYVLAALGLRAHQSLTQHPQLPAMLGTLIGSLLLGIAVSSTHFLAMEAAYFQPLQATLISPGATPVTFPPYGLAATIISATLVLLGVIALGTMLDRRLQSMATSLRHSETRFRQLSESTQTAIFTFDRERIRYANPALSRITGYEHSELLLQPLEKILGDDLYQLVQETLALPMTDQQVLYRQCRIQTPDGDSRWLYFTLTRADLDDPTIGLGSAVDISEQKQAEANLRLLAYTDPLTRLANRAHLMERLGHHLALLKRRKEDNHSCLMLMDLNGFKAINDSHGHLQGDRLLTRLGLRLRHFCRDTDTVARLGGDEFIVLFEEVDSREGIHRIAECLLAHLCRPVELDKGPIEIHLSLGVLELLPGLYQTADEALRDVDIALYRAKEQPGPSWTMFDESLDLGAQRERQLQGELKAAIARNELELHYQPIVDAVSQTVVGFESLARWQRSCGEWVSPAEFIPLAETMGMVSDIGLWATATAARQLDEWNRALGHQRLYISINLASVSFADERLQQLLQQLFKQYQLQPKQLKLELTEGMLMADTDSMLSRLHVLMELGCDLMIDDFGTGYSSLSYLHRLPVSILKVDRSFVAALEEGQVADPIINTILGLAYNLNMKVICEGVETENQVRHLLRLGCQTMQGYYFARPMPAAEASRYLLEHPPLPAQ